MKVDIEGMLKTVEVRLGETIEAFTVMCVINETCRIDPEKNAAINARGGYWWPVTLGLQTTVITGINAVLDKRQDCATLYVVLKALSSNAQRGFAEEIKKNLDEIRGRYEKFRHKLFAHNDIKREAMATEFDQAGFTWDSIAADLRELEYALKALWHLQAGEPVPNRQDAEKFGYMWMFGVAKAKEDTTAFLSRVFAQ